MEGKHFFNDELVQYFNDKGYEREVSRKGVAYYKEVDKNGFETYILSDKNHKYVIVEKRDKSGMYYQGKVRMGNDSNFSQSVQSRIERIQKSIKYGIEVKMKRK